jgi:tetratricopeptide (TPR) repeat protein
MDPRQAGQQLGATHVLTVGLQRDRDKIRATPVLTARDGRTLWSGTVDTDAASAFVVQDIIVTRVIEDLAPQLAAPVRRRFANPSTGNSAAFQAYLRGRVHLLRPARAELTRAVAFLGEAVAADPRFADAWAALATAHKRRPLFDARPAEAFAEARRAASRALAIEPGHPEATNALGTVAYWHDRDYPRAESLLRRALELQPSSVDGQVILAHLLSDLGRHDEALLEIQRARALDPALAATRSLEGQVLFKARRYPAALAQLDEVVAFQPGYPHGYTIRVYPLLALGRYEDAIRDCERSIELQLAPDVPGAARPHSFPLALKGYALARLGRRAAAETVLAELRSQAGDGYVPPHHEALLLHALGRDEEALARLRAGVEERDLFVTWLGVDPKWDDLRRTPAFRDVLKAVHLLEVSDRTLR